MSKSIMRDKKLWDVFNMILNMKRIIFFSFALTLLFVVAIGCGGKSKSGGNPAPAPSTPGTCVAGQIWSPQHNACLQQCGQQASYGIDPTTHQCIFIQGGTAGNNGSLINMWGGKIMLTNKSLYREFLRDYARVCDPIVIGWNGSYSCEYFDDYADFELWTTGNTLPAIGRAIIYVYSTWNTYFSTPIDGTFEPINDNTGFELRRTGFGGTPSYNDRISVLAAPGSLSNSEILLYLLYNDTEFGRVRARKK